LKYIFYISLSLFLPLSLSLTGEDGVHTLFTGQREREREIKREKEGERELHASGKCGHALSRL
jgi:hypothetical protein